MSDEESSEPLGDIRREVLIRAGKLGPAPVGEAPAAALAPDPAAEAAAREAELTARLKAEAAARHAEDIAQLTGRKRNVDQILDQLKARLQASIDKAKKDPGHTGYASTFLIDVEVKAREIVAWIDRHVGTDGPA